MHGMCGMCISTSRFLAGEPHPNPDPDPNPNPYLFKVENALKSSKYTALPMVYATSSMSYAIALICPNVSALKALAASLGVDQNDVGAMCANKDVLAAVLKDVKETCAAAKLAKFEMPAKVILIEELWTPENEMLTAVQKLKRREIVAKHKAAIDTVYV